jgi:hypothetical protein
MGCITQLKKVGLFLFLFYGLFGHVWLISFSHPTTNAGKCWAYIVGQDPSDSKSNQLHVNISQFLFIYSFEGIIYKFL